MEHDDNTNYRDLVTAVLSAVGAVGSLAVLEHEARPLAVLDQRANAKDFPVSAVALSFPEPGRPGRVPVLVSVPGTVFTCTPVGGGKSFQTDFAIVAVVRNEQQEIVRKLSANYALNVPTDKLDAFRKGQMLFVRETTLDPGIYTVETVAFDAPSGKATVRRRTIAVPGEAALRMSSVVLVARVERLKPTDRVAANSLRIDDTLLYPTLGAPLSKGRDKQVTFFVTVYTAPKAAVPDLRIEILKSGRVVGKVDGDLSAPDANGRIQFANAISLESLAPGGYELRLTVKDGKDSASSSSPFTVVP
jgi:hypothetical protein